MDATARAVIESAADAIVVFGTDRTVLLWNPAAERMFGWSAAEVIGLKPLIIPEELSAEHNAVLERVRGGGQVSIATRRVRKNGQVLDVRVDTSALTDGGGEVIGWVNIYHQTGEDDAARHYMAERARVVRRLGDVVARGQPRVGRQLIRLPDHLGTGAITVVPLREGLQRIPLAHGIGEKRDLPRLRLQGGEGGAIAGIERQRGEKLAPRLRLDAASERGATRLDLLGDRSLDAPLEGLLRLRQRAGWCQRPDDHVHVSRRRVQRHRFGRRGS